MSLSSAVTRAPVFLLGVAASCVGACGGSPPPPDEPVSVSAELRFAGHGGRELTIREAPDDGFRDVLLIGEDAFLVLGPDSTSAFSPEQEHDPCGELDSVRAPGETAESAEAMCRAAFPFVYEIAPSMEVTVPMEPVVIEADACPSDPVRVVRVRARAQAGETLPEPAPFLAVELARCAPTNAPQPTWTFARRADDDLGLTRLPTVAIGGPDESRRLDCLPDATPRRCLVLLGASGWHTEFPDESVRFGLIIGDEVLGHGTIRGGGPNGASTYADRRGQIYLVHRRCESASVARVAASGLLRVHHGAIHGAIPSFECRQSQRRDGTP